MDFQIRRQIDRMVAEIIPHAPTISQFVFGFKTLIWNTENEAIAFQYGFNMHSGRLTKPEEKKIPYIFSAKFKKLVGEQTYHEYHDFVFRFVMFLSETLMQPECGPQSTDSVAR